MADGPIQVVLRPESYRTAREPARGGGAGKDFFRDRDDAFVLHRDELARTLRSLGARRASDHRVNVVVQMRDDALAKSHRPLSALFSARRASHVGTVNYGELIIATTPANLIAIAEVVESAEATVTWRPDASGELQYSPTGSRSESSAIASIREWLPAEARGFTLDEAENWLAANPSTRAEVELLALPHVGSALREATIQEVRALRTQSPAFLELFALTGAADVLAASQRAIGIDHRAAAQVEARYSRHIDSAAFRRELARLESSSVVKRVGLGDVSVDDTPDAEQSVVGRWVASNTRSADRRPVVGVIDGGIDWQDGGTSSWVVGHTGYVAPVHRSIRREIHGTEIASIIVLGSELNPGFLNADEDCRVYDLDLFSADEYKKDYYPAEDDFFEVLRESVERAKQDYGVRVFNLSYNFRRAPGPRPFSLIAQTLDAIAIDLDVIFVISSGNLAEADQRDEWPAAEADLLAVLARAGAPDGLGAPAESIANVSVGALNPPGLNVGIEGAPTRYTRRSLRIPSVVKPDFGAPGGGTRTTPLDTTGMVAMTSVGEIVEVEGTSFAAPVVARYLASLDAAIAGDVPREVLLALATHHAKAPRILSRSKRVAGLSREFIGRGLLPSVAETLDGTTHQMTIVLSDVIQPKKKVVFPFRWPDSLTSPTGSCRGRVKFTLVAEPTLDHAHGVEAVRVNLEGAIKQLDPDKGHFEGRLQPTHELFTGVTHANERTLITELGKWFPVKSFETTMRGRGKSSDWILEIEYLTRAATKIPDDGVRFAAVLTVEDPKGVAPIYDEMRASLIDLNVALNDLRSWTTIGVRV
ncbi:S8 family serine peptidase [Protaetiibacter intestinalis]|uniref:Peptidase S8/S53 domain-containing protein n=1 Tax=Protaetiibacter intestinalis TaxID=2419774 RepID=A0A387B3N1_9MICO|nr:S8 family serine peptidase [Protaetiibacter intestinalis]AYF96917.1 hypothetical protein D7I47_00710 [Protaetiibacter intestinalis]